MKKSNLKKLVMMTLAMGALYVPGLASAEEAAAPQEFALDEVIVTANRMENKLVDTPANVAVVTAEEIERRNYQDAIEAVKNVPGVDVQSGARADQSYIYINGSERVLVMVDGRRINTDRGVTDGRAMLDAALLPNPNMIERIEIVKGGASTIYGTNAVGGVINIITKKANKNYIKIDVNTGSWGAQNYKAVVSHKEGKTGVIATVSKEKQNYIKYKEANTKKHNKWSNTKYDKTTASVKIEQEIGEAQLVTLAFDHTHKDGKRPGAVNSDSDGKGSDLNNNIALKYDWGIQSENPGYVQIYRNYSVNKYNQSIPYTTSGDAVEKRIGIDLQQNLKTSDDNTVIIGANYYNTKVDYDGGYSGKYNRSVNEKAIFVQDAWNFADTWTLTAGARFNNHSNAGSKFTGSASLNKKINEDSHAYLSWNQVFNSPKLDDLYYPDPWMLGNPDLKPETGNVYTMGYETKTGRKGYTGISAFYGKLNDAINWAENAAHEWHPYNVDEQKRRGFEINYKYQFDDRWTANASYTYVKVEDNKNDSGFRRNYDQLPNQYKLGVNYTDKKWNVDLIGRGASGGAKPNYVDSKYLTVDLSVNYQLKDNWKFYVKGYNLTNVAYSERAGSTGEIYNYPAAGRRFLVGTQVTF